MLPFIILILAAGPGTAEPPGPWEPHNAILIADTIVRGTVVNYTQRPGVNPQESGQAVLTLRILEILKDESQSARTGATLNVLIPHVVPTQLETRGVPDRFQNGGDLLAALAFSTESKQYKSSSDWDYLSFITADQRAQERMTALLKDHPYPKSRALQSAATTFGVPSHGLRISVIGGTIRGNQFTYTKNTADPESSIIWRVWQPGVPKNALHLNAKTGEPLELVKAF